MARYLITLDPGVHADKAAAQAAIVAAGASVVTTYSFSYTYEVDATAEQVSAIAGLKESVEKSAPLSVVVQAVNQQHLSNLAETSASSTIYTPANTGAGGHIYIVDTGLYADHQEFAGRNINNLYSNFNGDFADNTGHGTAVASVIVGNTQGVSKDATLHVVKLFDTNSGNITIGEIIDALEEILAHHQGLEPEKAKVVCLPWATAQNNFLDNKIAEMNASNLVVVAAAGNDGSDVNNFSPAGVNSVITVGAYDENLQVSSFTNVPWTSSSTAYFNNYGAALDIFAMGVNVSCAGTASNSDYITVSGTSVAAGIVAGAAIQWINTYPEKSSNEIKETILQEGHYLGMRQLTFDTTLPIATSELYSSVITVPMANQVTLGSLPSGRVLDIQLGNTATKNLELNLTDGTDFTILSFAPMPPWASVDFSTGVLSADLTNADPSLAPGIYLFGIKGTIAGKVYVEEYSIGVYNNSVSELEEATQYYYDTDTMQYDQVIAYNVAASQKK